MTNQLQRTFKVGACVVPDPAPTLSLVEDALMKQNFGVNQMAARLAVQLLTNLFTKGFVNNHGAMFNTESMTTTPLNIDPNVWATYGYESI